MEMRLNPYAPFYGVSAGYYRRNRAIAFVEVLAEDTIGMMAPLIAVFIAVLGGVVNWIRKTRKKNWGSFIAAIVTAAFTGLLSHLLTSWLELDIHLQYAISGAAGYSGGLLLDTIVPTLLHMVHARTGERTGGIHSGGDTPHAQKDD